MGWLQPLHGEGDSDGEVFLYDHQPGRRADLGEG